MKKLSNRIAQYFNIVFKRSQSVSQGALASSSRLQQPLSIPPFLLQK